MKAADLLTHIDNPEDLPFLRTPLFDVNMRLFHGSQFYQTMIRNICRELKTLALSEYEDYSRPFGMSGANMGLPFNIVGYVVDRDGTGGMGMAHCRILINPKIHETSSTTHVARSNCGSIRLPRPIRIRRWDWVDVGFFNEAGEPRREVFLQNRNGDTIQHEVDHNRGILITDLAIKGEG